MLEQQLPIIIAKEIKSRPEQVTATIKLLDEGNTIPFIARYRKEVTGELDEEQIRTIDERTTYLRNLIKRQQEILTSIEAQEKLTPELQAAIENTQKLQDLEDLYLPYRPKKRTRAMIAREKGLEPLAEILLSQPLTIDINQVTQEYLSEEKEVNSIEEALAGASDIVAESTAENAGLKELVRRELWRTAEIACELAVDEKTGEKFTNYHEYSEPIRQIPPHRILAVNRGEKLEILKVKLVAPHETIIEKILWQKLVNLASPVCQILQESITDSYKRLLFPSLEREIRSDLTEKAEKHAINVFGRNLRQLLLQPPLAKQVVLGMDPGYRTGCKLAVVDQQGRLLDTGTIYIVGSEAQNKNAQEVFLSKIAKNEVTLISIGNGTASYETEQFVAELINKHKLDLSYIITNEAGASVYSASKLAKEEFPDLDVSIRGAVSIARRIQDPLAELVKIEPKSIGVGQYQHDVNQKELTNTLTSVVESSVNHVGVNLNTASAALLSYVAGVQNSVAKNIINWRNENGQFKNRKQLLQIPRLGPAAYTQCAGFLRVSGGDNPLDNTPVHPESYDLAKQIIKELGFEFNKTVPTELQNTAEKADAKTIAEKLNTGLPTVKDILDALAKPGRDPRESMPKPLTRKNITKLSDLQIGSKVTGVVHNITDFGVFVDIGIKTNGLIHRSELSYKPFRHPLDILSVGDVIDCVIISIDEERNRIGLSLKQAQEK